MRLVDFINNKLMDWDFKLNALLNHANDTTGAADSDLGAAIDRLIAGYGAKPQINSIVDYFNQLTEEFGAEFETTFSVDGNGTDVIINHTLGRTPTKMIVWAELEDSDAYEKMLNKYNGSGYVLSYCRKNTWGTDNFDNRTYILSFGQFYAPTNKGSITSVFDVYTVLTKTAYNATGLVNDAIVTIRNGVNVNNKLVVNTTYHILLK